MSTGLPRRPPFRTATAGIGGFGQAHHTALNELEEQGRVRLVATCDPMASRLDDFRQRFRFEERGVGVYEDFTAMLDAHEGQLDLVTIAAPIGVHAAMHRACIERGIPCYLEKPPTLDPEELEAMIAAETRATVPTEVGFNYIYQPFRHTLKARILKGDFGPLRRIAFHGLWPRSLTYFGRNNWAGRLLSDKGAVILDSCCGNAMAHHLHNVLFFAGSEAESWGELQTLQAELYRANAIQGTDTVFARGTLSGGIELRLAASHGSHPLYLCREILSCENAEIEIIPGQPGYLIRHGDGRIEEHTTPQATLTDNLSLYCDLLEGKRSRPSTLLSDSRTFVQLNALLYLATAEITPIPEAHLSSGTERGDTYIAINDIEAITREAIATGRFPSEQGGIPWAAAPSGNRTAVPADLERLVPRLRELIG